MGGTTLPDAGSGGTGDAGDEEEPPPPDPGKGCTFSGFSGGSSGLAISMIGVAFSLSLLRRRRRG
jgi:hypothetical protein